MSDFQLVLLLCINNNKKRVRNVPRMLQITYYWEVKQPEFQQNQSIIIT